MDLELRELSFGETIGKSFNLLINNFPKMFLTHLLSMLPYLGLTIFLVLQPNLPFLNVGFSLGILVMGLGIMAVYIIGAMMMVRFAADNYLGRKSDIHFSFEKSISRLGPFIGLMLLGGLIQGLASLFFIIPGIIVAIGFSCIIPIFIFEDKKVTESLQRSFDLTKDNRMKIFGLFVVTAILICLGMITVSAMLILIMNIFGSQPVMFASMALFFIAMSAVVPMFYNLLVVNYFNLRIQKEGFNIEHLSWQFDMKNSREEGV